MNWPITTPSSARPAIDRHPRASGGPRPAVQPRGPYPRASLAMVVRWRNPGAAGAGMTGSRRLDCRTPFASLFLGSWCFQLDVFPRIRVARRFVCREHVFPFRGRNARPDRIDKGVAEDWDEIVVFEDLALDLLC